MSTKFDDFKTQVIDVISVPHHGTIYNYRDYLALDDSERGGDEANFVDDRFSKLLLGWLGYGQASYTYNQNASSSDRPDYVVRKNSGVVAFTVEDKATPIDFLPKHADQLRRYTSGTAGYAIWTNARRILGLRFDPQGNYSVLVDVRITDLFGPQSSLFAAQVQNNIEHLHHLFCAAHYNDIDAKILSITTDPLTHQPITEQAWQAQASPVTNAASLSSFVAESGNVLVALTIAARARLDAALQQVQAIDDLYKYTQETYRTSTAELVSKLQSIMSTQMPPNLEAQLTPLQYHVEDLNRDVLDKYEPPNLTSSGKLAWVVWRDGNIARVTELQVSRFSNPAEQRITEAYEVWTKNYRIIEDASGSDDEREAARHKAYAEQVAYVFFVRLLLARVLEDKQIMPRLISDGGFASWHNFLDKHFYQSALGVHGIDNELFPAQLVTLLFKGVSRYYLHFYNQPVFDWFEPDDYLLAIALEHLNRFNFDHITADIIGFTYENFIDRTARNRKGHFLTRPEVVEYMLDQAGYSGPDIIGRTLLDPACGSGSFLVHAARRLRDAYVQSHASTPANLRQREIATAFVQAVQDNLFGMDINPFSCYLAELNLFIQVLDDMVYLWRNRIPFNLYTFNIYNTNSLELPREVLQANPQQLPAPPSDTQRDQEDLLLGEGAHLKRRNGQFNYVIANPPYVNRGIVSGAPAYKSVPFYADILSGDENTYLLFLQLASYYCAVGGVVCYVVPLTLFADKASQRAREVFANSHWTINNLTRFYTERVLFPGVTQAVCVASFTKQPPTGDYNIIISGGHDVAEAQQPASIVSVPKYLVSNSHLQSRHSNWYKAWLVINEATAYDVWAHIRGVIATDVEAIIMGKLEASQGDVNATYAKPLYSSTGDNLVPITKGELIRNYGGWNDYAQLSYKTSGHGASKYALSTIEGARKKVERIATLSKVETAMFLREVANIGLQRRINGTLIERDKNHPVVADHTLLSIYATSSSYNDLVYAMFALLTSSISNYIYGLFSTNNHVSISQLLRTPTPAWTPTIEAQLAGLARAAMQAGLLLDSLLRGQGGSITVSSVLASSNIPTMRLGDAVASGRLMMSGRGNSRVMTLLKNGQLAVRPPLDSNAAYVAIVQAILSDEERSYDQAISGSNPLRLPDPNAAAALQAAYTQATTDLATRRAALDAAIKAIDDAVYDWYSIANPTWRSLIDRGMPWSV